MVRPVSQAARSRCHEGQAKGNGRGRRRGPVRPCAARRVCAPTPVTTGLGWRRASVPQHRGPAAGDCARPCSRGFAAPQRGGGALSSRPGWLLGGAIGLPQRDGAPSLLTVASFLVVGGLLALCPAVRPRSDWCSTGPRSPAWLDEWRRDGRDAERLAGAGGRGDVIVRCDRARGGFRSYAVEALDPGRGARRGELGGGDRTVTVGVVTQGVSSGGSVTL